nr:hypothetical protein [Tanacetum cinerariifolium]
MTLTVGEEYVARALSELTGMPSSTFGKNAMEKVKSLKDWLNSQVIVGKKLFCVLLLDEFDKACTEIHKSLLYVLDEGPHLMNSISEKDSFASASKR